MIHMTYNEAMTIQRAQIAYYRQLIGRPGIKAIRARTLPCPGNPDTPMTIFDINELVPRGGDFEYYLLPFRQDKHLDSTNVAWHDAIRKGTA